MTMIEVAFFSEGKRLVGTLHTPDADGPWPTIVQNPGWLELRCSSISEQYHKGLTQAGFAVLQYDIRGYGDSEGESGWIRPTDQLEDLLSATTFVTTLPQCDPDRIGLFALGGVAGGVAILAAREDRRVKAICAQSVVSDGGAWFRDMRREHEWVAFKQRVTRNRVSRVTQNVDERVDPREELMVATPERRATTVRRTDDERVGMEFRLSSAEGLLRFRPLESVEHVSPCALLLTSVLDDVVTPEYHALALYERARPPKKLVRQLNVTHYESYQANYSALIEQFVDWYRRFLRPGAVTGAEDRGPEVVTVA